MPGSNGSPAAKDEYQNRLQEMLQKAQADGQQAKAAAAEKEAPASRDAVSERIAAELAKVKGDAPAVQPEPPDDFEDESPSQDELVEEPVEQLDDGGEEESELVHETGPAGSGEKAVQQGECISSIAKDTGHFWETIWKDAANTELREIRKNPNVLLPDDRVHVPPLRRKEEPGQTETRHRFVRRGEPALVRIVLKYAGQPRTNERYVLEIEDRIYAGMTDTEGRLQHAIPGNAKHGRLMVGQGRRARTYNLELGQLDPITSLAGLQARLNNLGFACGPATGQWSSDTERAVRRFQDVYRLPVTGQPDDVTRERIKQAHGF